MVAKLNKATLGKVTCHSFPLGPWSEHHYWTGIIHRRACQVSPFPLRRRCDRLVHYASRKIVLMWGWWYN